MLLGGLYASFGFSRFREKLPAAPIDRHVGMSAKIAQDDCRRRRNVDPPQYISKSPPSLGSKGVCPCVRRATLGRESIPRHLRNAERPRVSSTRADRGSAIGQCRHAQSVEASAARGVSPGIAATACGIRSRLRPPGRHRTDARRCPSKHRLRIGTGRHAGRCQPQVLDLPTAGFRYPRDIRPAG